MASFSTIIGRQLKEKKTLMLLLAAVLVIFLRMTLSNNAKTTNTEKKSPGDKSIYEYAPRKTFQSDAVELNDEYGFNNSKLMRHLEEFNFWLDGLQYQRVPEDLLRSSSCPVCYGNDLCPDVVSGSIQIHYPEPPLKENLKGVYYGKAKDQSVVLKQLSSKVEYSRLDKFLCNNITRTSDCDVGKAVTSKESFVMREEAFLPKNLHQARRISQRPENGPTFTLCADSELISELSVAYDTDEDGKLSAHESARFWFSAVVNPEAVIMQFVENKLETPLPMAGYIGACGRAVVQEAVGRPVSEYMNESFNFRADVASQMLDLIDNLLYGDSNWILLWADMMLDNLAVSESGELIMIDAEDIVIVNKKITQTSNSICNWEDCIEPHTSRLMDMSSRAHEESCALLPYVGENAMYRILCHILSDNPDHWLPGQRSRNVTKGVLHDAPEELQEDLKRIFDECSRETKPGGRVDAMDDLKEFLSAYSYDYSSYETDFDRDIMKDAGLAV